MKVNYARTFFQRARGMLWGKGPNPGECLVIVPCCDIHTVGMRWNIDVAFVDACGRVLMAKRDMPPFRRLRCRCAFAVVERRSCDLPWFHSGDHLPWLIEKEGSKS